MKLKYLIKLLVVLSLTSVCNAKEAYLPLYYSSENGDDFLIKGNIKVNLVEVNKPISKYKDIAGIDLFNFICAVSNYPNHKSQDCYKKVIASLDDVNKNETENDLNGAIEFIGKNIEDVNHENIIRYYIETKGGIMFILYEPNDEFTYSLYFKKNSNNYILDLKSINLSDSLITTALQNLEDDEVEELLGEVKKNTTMRKGYTHIQIKDHDFNTSVSASVKWLNASEIEKNGDDPIINLYLTGKKTLANKEFKKLAELYTNLSKKTILSSVNNKSKAYLTSLEDTHNKRFNNPICILNFDPLYIIVNNNKDRNKEKLSYLYILKEGEENYKFTNYSYYNDFTEYISKFFNPNVK